MPDEWISSYSLNNKNAGFPVGSRRFLRKNCHRYSHIRHAGFAVPRNIHTGFSETSTVVHV